MNQLTAKNIVVLELKVKVYCNLIHSNHSYWYEYHIQQGNKKQQQQQTNKLK